MPTRTLKSSKATRSQTAGNSRKKSPTTRSNKRTSTSRANKRNGAAQTPPTPTVLGRCGGRPLLSAAERDVCDRLTSMGVAHSHRPRHFEITLEDGQLAAFAPTMVVRGRGREGKTVLVETAENAADPNLDKVRAFRKQYGLEFYICLVAPEEVLEDILPSCYDEAASLLEMHTILGRLAD